jgi:hypothetical protein
MTMTITTESPAGVRPASFKVMLLFLIGDEALRARIRPDDGGLGEGEAVVGHGEVFRFSVECVGDEDELDRRLALCRLRETPGRFVLISDRLTVRDRRGKLGPSPLVTQVREPLRTGRHLGGLVALVEGPAGRVSDVDRVVARDAGRAALREAIVGVATGLRLKAPPPVRPEGTSPAGVTVQAVQSPEQLRGCLALRRQVYGLLGYLPDAVMADPSGLDLDGYDVGSIHFAALRAGEVVGTVRLVTELPLPSAEDPQANSSSSSSGISFIALHTHEMHARWCKAIARKAGTGLRARATSHPFMPLPILQSTEFETRWSQALQRFSPGAELSRLVVAPHCRGLNISCLLVQAAIAKTIQMKRRILLLECIPAHEEMYHRKYGFRRLSLKDPQGRAIAPELYPHSRPTDLDQYAVALGLPLDRETRTSEGAEKRLVKILMGLNPSFGPLDVPIEVQ